MKPGFVSTRNTRLIPHAAWQQSGASKHTPRTCKPELVCAQDPSGGKQRAQQHVLHYKHMTLSSGRSLLSSSHSAAPSHLQWMLHPSTSKSTPYAAPISLTHTLNDTTKQSLSPSLGRPLTHPLGCHCRTSRRRTPQSAGRAGSSCALASSSPSLPSAGGRATRGRRITRGEGRCTSWTGRGPCEGLMEGK